MNQGLGKRGRVHGLRVEDDRLDELAAHVQLEPPTQQFERIQPIVYPSHLHLYSQR